MSNYRIKEYQIGNFSRFSVECFGVVDYDGVKEWEWKEIKVFNSEAEAEYYIDKREGVIYEK